METLNEIVRDLERMAQTLDCVKSTDEWADGPADIADIYRSVARRIRSVIGYQTTSRAFSLVLDFQKAMERK